MKKVFTLMLTLVMALSLVACGGAKEEEAPPAEEQAPAVEQEAPAAEEEAKLETIADGVLTVATSPDFAPYEFYAIDENGNPSLAGFDMALAQYIADYLNLKLEIVPMDFDGVLIEVANGTVDLGLAGLSPDPARMDAMDFSDIYYDGGQAFVTVTAKKDQFTDLASANTAGISVGAQTGSIQMDLANEYSPDTEIISLPKVTDIIAELISGKLDGAYIETVVAESYKANYPELEIVAEVPYDVEGSAIGVVKGNEALLQGVNEAIAAALADGSMDKFVAEANELATGNIHEGLLEG